MAHSNETPITAENLVGYVDSTGGKGDFVVDMEQARDKRAEYILRKQK